MKKKIYIAYNRKFAIKTTENIVKAFDESGWYFNCMVTWPSQNRSYVFFTFLPKD